MAADLLSFLSRDFTKMFDNNENSDLTLTVGPKLNSRVFKVHIVILRARCPLFYRLLDKAYGAQDVKMKNARQDEINNWLEPIFPQTFEIILKYIYGAVIALENYKEVELLNVLHAASILEMIELVNHVIKFLIQSCSEWLKKNFARTYHGAFAHDSLKELQAFCDHILLEEPETVFNAIDFPDLSEQMVIALLSRVDVSLEETDIWDQILKWGIIRTPGLNNRIADWTSADFAALKDTLARCLPLIRFFSIPSADFNLKVVPFQDILPKQLFRDLIGYHLQPGYEPVTMIMPSRGFQNRLNPNPTLLSEKAYTWLGCCIDRKDTNSDNPYEFRLIFRGSRDGFNARDFHRVCDNQGPTITVLQVAGTGELIGGYNPLKWNSNDTFEHHSDCFLFGLGTKKIFKPFKSRLIQDRDSVGCYKGCGPNFGGHYGLYTEGDLNKDRLCQTGSGRYEYNVRGTREAFSVDDYEVFQVVMKSI